MYFHFEAKMIFDSERLRIADNTLLVRVKNRIFIDLFD